MLRDGADDVDLWAMAAELERQFAGYKQRLAGRRGGDVVVDVPDDDVVGASTADDDAHGGGDGGGSSSAHGEDAGDACGGDVRGRMYDAYTRRRDERLRSGWRARMERKEAEVMALWAQLDRGGGRASGGGETTPGGGGGPTTAGDIVDGGTAGEVQQEAEDDGDIKRRSSAVAAPPRRISGKKHARTRSFSSTTLKSSRPDVGRRRALSQEPLPSEPPASADGGASRKVDAHRARAVVGIGGTAAPKRKALISGSKGSAKEHGSLKHAAGPKPPRSLTRRCSSGGLEGLGEAAPVQTSCSSEQIAADRDEAQAASPSRPLVWSGNADGGIGTASTRDASPDSDRGEVVDSVAAEDGGEAEAKNVDVEKRDDEEITVYPEKLGSGEITSDSETEPSYVYIVKKVVVEEKSMRPSEALAPGSDAKPHLEGENGSGNADEATTATTVDGANFAAERATTNVEEAPARESFDESSFSGRSGRSSPPNSAPSCSSRAQPIERLLEADAALLRRKRDESATEKSAMAVSTPGSAGSRVSGATPRTSSPRETPRGFKKRFLSFGKKNKGREPATVIDCTSPSVVDDDGASGQWQTADSIKPRMGSSDTASDDTDHGYAASPQACSLQSLVAASPAKSELGEIVPREKSPKPHRSFFSLRSFNCGRS